MLVSRPCRFALVVLAIIAGGCTEQHLTGNITYLRHIHSQYMTFDRDVILYLPPDYDTNLSARYPVLYMNDGEMLMDATTAGGQEWGVDETAQRLINGGLMAPTIIVGVYGAGYGTDERLYEYTQVPQASSGGGGADAYGRFLTLELKPMIDAQFRTLPGADTTGIAGSSDGGLVSLYFGVTLPETFTRIGAMSPDTSWANADITMRVSALTTKPPLRIWLDVGTNEGSLPMRNVMYDEQLRDALVEKGWSLGDDLHYLEVPGGQHDTTDWGARVDQVFEYLYPPTN